MSPLSMFARLRQTREEKYRERMGHMSSAQIAKAYVDLSLKVDALTKLTHEYTNAFSRNPLPREYLPRYSDLDNNFEADEREAYRLLKKAKVWVSVLGEAISQRNIATDDLTIPVPGRPRIVGKRADFSPYSSSFPRA